MISKSQIEENKKFNTRIAGTCVTCKCTIRVPTSGGNIYDTESYNGLMGQGRCDDCCMDEIVQARTIGPIE